MYQAIYKCRLCGEEYVESEIEKDGVAMASIHEITRKENFYHKEYVFGLHRLDYHNCQDGSFGLADFQGFKKAEE